ncbi:MAG: hypothetical protein JJ896_09685 [Rhodothermales bacterium]|nr:hypothetical protein [Rhodothermales bacterium]MBO6779910.1 hypothetical protein [Rhodothermales bacterium]
MSELDEHIIEVWIRNPESLPAAQQEEISRNVERFPEWREVADYWREFYRVLGAVSREQPRTAPASAMKLVRSQAASAPPARSMAAADVSEFAIRELGTFLSEDGSVAVRCLLDEDRSEVLVRVIAPRGSGRVREVLLPVSDSVVSIDGRGHGSVAVSESLVRALSSGEETVEVRMD